MSLIVEILSKFFSSSLPSKYEALIVWNIKLLCHISVFNMFQNIGIFLFTFTFRRKDFLNYIVDFFNNIILFNESGVRPRKMGL